MSRSSTAEHSRESSRERASEVSRVPSFSLRTQQALAFWGDVSLRLAPHTTQGSATIPRPKAPCVLSWEMTVIANPAGHREGGRWPSHRRA